MWLEAIPDKGVILSSNRRLLAVATATALLASMITSVPLTAHAAPCTTYYVSSSGDDSDSGCSPTEAWRTTTPVNATTFGAGDQILFEAGGVWNGQLHPLGSGTAGNPVVIDSYGAGARPIINGNGAAAAVYLYNQQYWTVTGLEIKNTSSTVAQRAGFLARNDTTGILHGIHVVDNDINSVDGSWGVNDPQPTHTSAINFEVTDANTTGNWNDVHIAGNTITDVDAGAIYIGSPVGVQRDISTTNVVIENNTIRDAGGNSIVCVFCDAPLVQYNVATDSGYRFSGAALWSGWTNDGVWQYNEVARNSRAYVDGQAFDIDNYATDTVVQYNYSHDNPWGFVLVCCNATWGALGKSEIRYNISQNDGAAYAVFSGQNGLKSGGTVDVYNNTIYLPENNNGDITSSTPNTGTSFTYRNNLIYKLGTGGYNNTRTSWSNNLFFGHHPTTEPGGTPKLTGDPLLVNAGAGTDGRASASVYQLQAGSPALGAGAVIAGNGGLDFFGNSVSATSAPNIGAYNGPGVQAPTRGTGTYLRFNETAGSTALDSSRANNTGLLQPGATRVAASDGSGAVAFSGSSNSWVDLATPSVDTSQSYSVSAWVKPATLSGYQSYVSTDGVNISPFYLQLEGGKFAFTQRSTDSTSAGYAQVKGLNPVAGTWYHLTGIYDAGAQKIRLYVNGELQGSANAVASWKANGHTTVGRAKWNGANVDFANASVDDVRLIPRALTTQEAVAIGTGATAYLGFDETTGIFVGDSTGNQPRGSLAGQATWTTGSKFGPTAASFNGTKGTVATIPSAPIDTGQSFTISTWVKPAVATGGNQTYLSMPSFPVSPFYLQFAGGKFQIALRHTKSLSPNASLVTSPDPVVAGTWYHLAAVYDRPAGTLSLYINGILKGSTSAPAMWTAKAALVVGAGEWDRQPVDFVNGTIDSVSTYQRALTAAEIGRLAAP